ncbi:hypothetical protein CRG98_008054 [Punica granatum]|uniref:Secreted protein n=1 Tax=Punica granatum TaxID=22663 RepID=A0A2I0KST7_PUNGR|nr:hypothetical protein CRG98_008054 [Punica granatum]
MRFLICATLLVTASSVLPSPTIVVMSFVRTTLEARPRTSLPTLSRVRPTSSLMTLPPVNTAMSSRYWLFLSPNPGALRAAIFRDPLSLFTTRVAKASCSISSAIIKTGYPPLMASSRTFMRSLAFVIFLSTRRSLQLSYSTTIFSVSVTK